MTSKTYYLSRILLNTFIKPHVTGNFINRIERRWAGHSKWANIKHTKMAKDAMKASLSEKLTRKIIAAAKEGDNPAHNHKLKVLVEEAKKLCIPNATIENAIKKAKNLTSEKPFWLIYKGDELMMAFEMTTSNQSQAIAKVNSAFKKSNLFLKHDKHGVEYYEERGLIVAQPQDASIDYEKAVEDAIIAGAEEVTEIEEKTYLFECPPTYLDNVTKKLEGAGYSIQSSTTEIEFHKNITVNNDVQECVSSFGEKLLSKHEDILRIVDNIKQ